MPLGFNACRYRFAIVTLTAFTPRQQHPTGSLAHKVHKPSRVMQLFDMYLFDTVA